ncbi:MAG TPA: LysR family transcriptional regulator, partial [Terriglobales bacterium]
MKLSRFDLNLLVTFDAVFRHGSVSKAAEQLGRSQPAVSHALQRLRWLLRDSLFIKSPQGMRPTPRAEALAGRVRHLLEQFQLSLEPEKFDPERESRRFAIAVNNYAAVVFTGPVIAKCTAQAPLIRLAFRPSGTLDILPMLERGEL